MLVADGKKGRVSAGKGRGFSRAGEVVKSLYLPWKDANLWPHKVLLPLNRGKGHFPGD